MRWRLLFCFGVLSVTWALIFLVPVLRDMVHAQIFGSTLLGEGVIGARQTPPRFWPQQARLYSNDARIAVWAVEAEIQNHEEDDVYDTGAQAVTRSRYPELNRSYDLLIRRFSRDPLLPLLLARRLQYTFGWMQPDRIGGKLSLGYMDYYQRRERLKRAPNYSRHELDAAIALCRCGQKMEPDNAFFDWALCKLLLAAWRDEEAWRTLAGAARKTRYDAHEKNFSRVAIAAHEIAWRRKLLWEEKRRLIGARTPNDLFEEEATNIVAWHSVKARRRKDAQRALSLAANLLRLNALRWEGSLTRHDAQNTVDAEANLIAKIGYGFRGRKSFVLLQYARRHSPLALAREMAQMQAQAKARRIALSGFMLTGQQEDVAGLDYRRAASIALLWHSGTILLLLLGGAAMGRTLVELLARWHRLSRTFRSQPGAEPVEVREIIGGAFACCGLRAGGSALFGIIVGILCAGAIAILTGQRNEIEKLFSDIEKSVTAPSFWFDFWQSLWHSLNYGGELPFWFRSAVLMLPFLLGTLHAAWRATARQLEQNGEGREPRFWPLFVALCNGRFWRNGLEYDFSRAFLKLLDWVFLLIMLSAWLMLAFWHERDWWFLAPLFGALFFAGALLVENLVRWKGRPRQRGTARYGFALLRASLLTWLVMGSTLYLLILLASLPMRKPAETRLELLLQHGEVTAAQMQQS